MKEEISIIFSDDMILSYRWKFKDVIRKLLELNEFSKVTDKITTQQSIVSHQQQYQKEKIKETNLTYWSLQKE